MIDRCGRAEFTFKPGINILAGSNGSGKSTLLQAIMKSTGTKLSSGNARIEISDPRFPMPMLYHSADEVVKSEDSNKGSNLLSLQANAESHGQTLSKYLLGLENLVDPSIILIDEPETALDLDHLLGFSDIVQDKVEEGMQFIIATHHPVLWMMDDIHTITFGANKKYVKECLAIFRDISSSKKARTA
jgi:predicted ATPase